MNCTDHDNPDCPQPVCIEREAARRRRRGTKKCTPHNTPDCTWAVCAVQALQAERDLLRAEIDTAAEEPLIILKALKNAEAQVHALRDVSSDLVNALEDAKSALCDVAGKERTIVAIDNDHDFWVKVNDALDAYYKWFKGRKLGTKTIHHCDVSGHCSHLVDRRCSCLCSNCTEAKKADH